MASARTAPARKIRSEINPKLRRSRISIKVAGYNVQDRVSKRGVPYSVFRKTGSNTIIAFGELATILKSHDKVSAEVVRFHGAQKVMMVTCPSTGRVVVEDGVGGGQISKNILAAQAKREAHPIIANQEHNPGLIARVLTALSRMFGGEEADTTLPQLPAPEAAKPVQITEPAAAALAASAEVILAHYPDATDAAGARLDTLIREYLPRLADRHATTLKTARRKARTEAMATYNECIALVSQSVSEAAERVETQLQQALTTELRFLQMRRGEEAQNLLPSSL